MHIMVRIASSGMLVATSVDGLIRLYDSQFHLLLKRQAHSGKQPWSARFSPDGKHLAIGFQDAGSVDVFSTEHLDFQRSLQAKGLFTNLQAVAWAEQGKICAGGGYQGNRDPVLCWNEAGNKSPADFDAGTATILDIRALRNGAIAFCDSNGSVGVLNQNGAVRWRADPTKADLRDLGLPSHPRLSSDGETVEIASLYADGASLKRHNGRFSVAERRLDIDAKTGPSLTAPATQGLAIEGWRDTYRPTLAGKALQIEEHEFSRSLAVSSDKSSFVLGTAWYVRKFDSRGNEMWTISAPGTVWGVNITADQRYVVATLDDGTVRWYTFDGGKEVLALFIHHDLRRWVAWNPDGFFTFDNGGDQLIGYHLNRGPGKEGDFVKVDQLIDEKDCYARLELAITVFLQTGASQAFTAIASVLHQCSHQQELKDILRWELRRLSNQNPALGSHCDEITGQLLGARK